MILFMNMSSLTYLIFYSSFLFGKKKKVQENSRLTYSYIIPSQEWENYQIHKNLPHH